MSYRYAFGGDEHIFAEVSEAMSLEAFFKSLSMCHAIKESRIKGITEVCPANASFQVRFDPDMISPNDLLTELKRLEQHDAQAEHTLKTRIIQVPVLYDDPWTHETMTRFRERHQDPDCSDLEYAARINNFASSKELIAAHAGSPWFISMVGFVAGLPFLYQMVERSRQIQVPKYLRYTQTDSWSWRLFRLHLFCARRRRVSDVRHHPHADLRPQARDPLPARCHGVLPTRRHRAMATHRSGSPCNIAADAASGQFVPLIREVAFSLDDYNKDIDGYNRTLGAILHGH